MIRAAPRPPRRARARATGGSAPFEGRTRGAPLDEPAVRALRWREC